MAAKKQNKSSGSQEIKNSKAAKDYKVEEKFEAGIALKGAEVKSIKAGNAQLSGAFARFEKDELFLYGFHVEEYSHADAENFNPKRPKKLLLKRKEINKIRGAIEAGGKAVVPFKAYLKQSLIKIQIAICTGKKHYDKREDLKKRVASREAERSFKYHK